MNSCDTPLFVFRPAVQELPGGRRRCGGRNALSGCVAGTHCFEGWMDCHMNDEVRKLKSSIHLLTLPGKRKTDAISDFDFSVAVLVHEMFVFFSLCMRGRFSNPPLYKLSHMHLSCFSLINSFRHGLPQFLGQVLFFETCKGDRVFLQHYKLPRGKM